jgi:hypothetical protein
VKYFIACLFAVVAALLLLSAAKPYKPGPVLSIGVLGYGSIGKGPAIAARMGAWVSTEVESWSGKTSRRISGLPLTFVAHVLLKPGSYTIVTLPLPPDTLRWQFSFKIRAASLSETVANALPPWWGSKLYPICAHLLSNRDGPEQEITTGVFEISVHGPLVIDGWTPPQFGSAPLWPGLTQQGAESPLAK